MGTLGFSAALMREKAGKVIADCRQIKKICGQIEQAAFDGKYHLRVLIDKDELPRKADIGDVVTFFRTMDFHVRVDDMESGVVTISWNRSLEPLFDIEQSLDDIYYAIGKK